MGFLGSKASSSTGSLRDSRTLVSKMGMITAPTAQGFRNELTLGKNSQGDVASSPKRVPFWLNKPVHTRDTGCCYSVPRCFSKFLVPGPMVRCTLRGAIQVGLTGTTHTSITKMEVSQNHLPLAKWDTLR